MESKDIKKISAEELTNLLENKEAEGLWNVEEKEFGVDNPFPFQPYGPYVIVRFVKRSKSKGGIILPETAEAYVPWAQVMQVGTTCNLDTQVGDVVLLKTEVLHAHDASTIQGVFEVAGVSYGIVREGSLFGRALDSELLKPVYVYEGSNREKNYEGKVLDGTKFTKG